MKLLAGTRAAIPPLDVAAAEAAQRLLDRKTKPRGSLGRLEEIATRIAASRGTALPSVTSKAIIVMGADHGVVEEGVSAYPKEVTRQMMLNFADGGAAINVLARHAGAQVVVVDMGIETALPRSAQVRDERVGPGTHNFTRGPAMTRSQAVSAVEAGIRLAFEYSDGGVDLVGIGEMGIGNTTAASALAAALTGSPAADVTGQGTGIDASRLHTKVAIIERALEVNRPDASDPIDSLAKLGGFEIAGLTGVILGSAARRSAVVLDGFITGVAALAAARLAPPVVGHLLASHLSAEPGHRIVLEELGLRPLLDLDLRLGEGTGAALAMPLIEASLRILHEMATFDSAGVSDSGA
jgi:nicotinate-nucleotide--dimethylbenzimidazole phosphoribosyltransferase